MRTQGRNEEEELEGRRAEEARDASSRKHGHVGWGAERAFGEVGPGQAGPGLGFPGGVGPGMECEAGGARGGWGKQSTAGHEAASLKRSGKVAGDKDEKWS